MPVGHLSRALASFFANRHAGNDRSRSEESNAHQNVLYLPLGEQTKDAAPQHQGAANNPSREEVLNYLGQLAKGYHIPLKVVYSVADAESSIDPKVPPHPNYKHRNGKVVHDQQGNPVIASWDYGLMQVNGSNIAKGEVQDAHGRPFKIGEDVKTDWRANARAGVALLAPAYRLAELEQGPGATAEDHAQQAYSQYNTGTERRRERYLKQKRDGLPQNDADRNFLEKYRRW